MEEHKVNLTLRTFTTHGATAINLKFLLQLGMILLIYLVDHISFQTFKIILNTSLKKHETIADNSPVQIYGNKIKIRIVFKIKTGCKFELLSLETMRLLGSSKKDVDQDKGGETSVEVVLVHCNLVNNNYQQASKVLFTFVPNKHFGQLINVSPHSLVMLNTTNTEFSFIEVSFTDQNSKKLEIEDNVNITLIIRTG